MAICALYLQPLSNISESDPSFTNIAASIHPLAPFRTLIHCHHNKHHNLNLKVLCMLKTTVDTLHAMESIINMHLMTLPKPIYIMAGFMSLCLYVTCIYEPKAKQIDKCYNSAIVCHNFKKLASAIEKKHDWSASTHLSDVDKNTLTNIMLSFLFF